MTVMYYFECKECGYDSSEAKKVITEAVKDKDPICPLCAGDNGRDVSLSYREATPEEVAKYGQANT